MKYKSYTIIIFAITLLFLAIALVLVYKFDGRWYMAIVPFAVTTISLLILKTPIDKYFFRYQEVGIDEKVFNMLQIEYPMISTFSPSETKEFITRMFHFLYDRDAYMITEETEELQLYHTAIIGAPAVIMSIKQKHDQAKDINRIAAYGHAFPSPKMKFLHSAEYDAEDGVMIVSLEQMDGSLRKPESIYHIVFHIWSERYLLKNPGFPKLPIDFGDKISTLFGFTKEKIDQLLGYEVTNYEAIALTAFYTRKENLRVLHPQFYSEIDRYRKS